MIPDKIANRDCRSYVDKRIPFIGNNLSGSLYRDKYVVSSYGHYPIFIHTDGQWYEVSDKYSVSTAKHIAQARPTSETILRTPSEMSELRW